MSNETTPVEAVESQDDSTQKDYTQETSNHEICAQDTSPPTEVLMFLVRTLSPRVIWQWLSLDPQLGLRGRVTRGFRAAAETLRQPAVRTRLVSYLEKNPDDFKVLLAFWGDAAPRVLQEVRELKEEALADKLSELENQHGAESLLLALLHEEKDDAIEVWTNAGETETEADAESTLTNNSPGNSPEDSLAELSPSSPPKAELEKIQKQLARETAKAEHWRAKFKDATTRAGQTEKTLRDKLNESEKQERESARQNKAESLRIEGLQTKIQESEKARERAERKLRSALTESQSANSELKTLRRQLHRLQQINEELRGQITSRDQQISELQKPIVETNRVSEKASREKPTVKIASAAIKKPVCEVQKICATIDRNDENFIATLRDELSVLQVRDEKTFNLLMKELRAAGKFYERVLRAQTVRVLVDASNVARYDAGANGKLRYLIAMRNELRRHDFFPIVFIADASLPFFIDKPKTLREMIAREEILVTASGQQADEVLAREAKQTGAYVVTNDRNFHFAFAPDFTPSRIGFGIDENVVLLEEF